MVGRMRRKEVTSTKQTTYHSTLAALIYYAVEVGLAERVCSVATAFAALLEFDYWTAGKSSMEINLNYERFFSALGETQIFFLKRGKGLPVRVLKR